MISAATIRLLGPKIVVTPYLRGGSAVLSDDLRTIFVGDGRWTLSDEIAEEARKLVWEGRPAIREWCGLPPYRPAPRTAQEFLDQLGQQLS